jgi:hypothetical protein
VKANKEQAGGNFLNRVSMEQDMLSFGRMNTAVFAASKRRRVGMRNGQRGRVSVVTILLVLVLIGGVLYGIKNQPMAPGAKARSQNQKDPEKALKFYMATVAKFTLMQEGGSFQNVEMVVTKDDWNWFQQNYEAIFKAADFANISTGANPTEVDALAKRKVLTELIDIGPNREGSEIVSREIGPDKATFVVKKVITPTQSIDQKVEMVKEGKYWKMKDFGGGRQALSKGL